jgi:hypothetical protein
VRHLLTDTPPSEIVLDGDRQQRVAVPILGHMQNVYTS